jgi:hypothetical protein
LHGFAGRYGALRYWEAAPQRGLHAAKLQTGELNPAPQMQKLLLLAKKAALC